MMQSNSPDQDIDDTYNKRSKNENSTVELPKKEKSLEPLPPKRELKMKSDDEGEEFLILPQGQTVVQHTNIDS